MKTTTSAIAWLALASLAFGNEISESQKKFIGQYEKHPVVAPEKAMLNTDAEPELADGFTSLYNGKDLDGWVSRGGKCEFEADGGEIIGRTVAGQPSTYLCTEREDFADFVFTVEVKWESPMNSGVMFRAQRRMEKKGGREIEVVYGPQAEMEGFSNSANRNWSGGLYWQSDGGWKYPVWLEAHKEARAALKEGEWNRLTILAKGKSLKTWLNGLPVANLEDGQYLKGAIGLQVHAGKRGVVRFRNVKVKEL
ncbi:MAG: 3-keto-disaccharide hydrolase [Verrucomicrobiales bacterium]|nr:DUF1080 domain-containing protein [Verrucomicrobiota bacterium JB025]